MGYLHYGNSAAAIEVDDARLAHLRAVVVAKLRRHEAFALTLSTSPDAVETMWVHAGIPLRFVMDEGVRLNRVVLAAMMAAANSAGGLDLRHERFSVDRLEDFRRQPVGA